MNITFNLTTETSTAVKELRWESDGNMRGDLFVTFTNGGTYRYDRVTLEDLMPVVTAADENGSIGSALHIAVLCWKQAAEKVAA